MQHPVNDIKEGSFYPVTVTKLLARGIVVKLDDTGTTEFIHISKISKKFISNIADFVNVGNRLVAKGIRGKNGTNELSLIHLHLGEPGQKVKEVHAEEVNEDPAVKNLNDMIAAAELSMHDKMGVIQARTERKRRKRIRNKYD